MSKNIRIFSAMLVLVMLISTLASLSLLPVFADEVTDTDNQEETVEENKYVTVEEAIEAYNMTVNLALVITSLSILIAYLSLEFAVPMILKNGQTVGKKVFGIGLVRQDCVRITPFMLFVRTLLGKCTVETMIPAYILILIIFGNLGMTGTVILVGFAVLQLALVATSRTNAAIHDMMAATVAVDLNSQMIFESEADLLAYKNKLHAENAAREKYYS